MDEKDNYYSQENRRLTKKVKELEEHDEYLKKKVKDLESSAQYDIKARYKEKNSIQIGGYSGISIPLDEVLKKEISEYIFKEVRKIVEEDKDFEDKFIKQALNYKGAFIRIFKPIVKEIIEDLDLAVRFTSDD